MPARRRSSPPTNMHRGYAHGDEPAFLFEVFAPARHDYIDLVEYQAEFTDKGEDWVKPGTFTANPFTGNDPTKKILPVYQLTDMPREDKLHQGRMRRSSIRTKHCQVVWAEITPAAEGRAGVSPQAARPSARHDDHGPRRRDADGSRRHRV